MEDKIRNFIIETFMYGEDTIENNEHLFEKNIIDSLGFIKLLTFLEKTFNVIFNMSEVTIDEFESINKIVATIKAKSSQ